MTKLPRKGTKRGEFLRDSKSFEVIPLLESLSKQQQAEALVDLRGAIRKAGGNPDNTNQPGGTVLAYLLEELRAKGLKI